jgi:hypothetical protein
MAIDATHRGPLGGMIVITVAPGTEILAESGEIEIVDDEHCCISRKGAVYVTPAVLERLKAACAPEDSE